MSKIILVSGGIKSGKSDFAENIAKKHSEITYVALSDKYPDDKDWQKKISIHKSKRPIHWKTIETLNLLNVLKKEKNVLLIDSIGGFVFSKLNLNQNDWIEQVKLLIEALLTYKKDIIIVGEQTGWSLVSEFDIGKKFSERLGEILSEITKVSDENWLTINGKALSLDNLYFKEKN